MILHPLDRLLERGFRFVNVWDADNVPWILVGERADHGMVDAQRFSVEDVADVVARWEELFALARDVMRGREVPLTHRHLFLRAVDAHGHHGVFVVLGSVLVAGSDLHDGATLLRGAVDKAGGAPPVFHAKGASAH